MAILNAALDHGFYYWDTATSYRNKDILSEERLGLVLQDRRKEVFLATKTDDRTYDGAMRQFETSTKRLQYRPPRPLPGPSRPFARRRHGDRRRKRRPQSPPQAPRRRRSPVHRNHRPRSAEAMAEAARRYDFDTMFIALNHYADHTGDMEKRAIPVAAAKGMGVMLIKVIRPRETVKDILPETLIRYGLSLEGVHAAVIGTDSVDVVLKNAALLKEFKPLDPAEMARVRADLGPFFASRDIPWMRPGYRDGDFV